MGKKIISIIIVVLFASTAYMRNRVWVDKITLWGDVVSKSPQKARAYNNLGEAYHQKKIFDKAVENYNKSIQLNPYLSLDAYSNLASIYLDIGQYDRAIDAFTKTLYINMNDHIAYANRANVYFRKGDYTSAIRDYTVALSISPSSAQIYFRRAGTYVKLRNSSSAREDYKKACMLGVQEACLKLGNSAPARSSD